MFTKTFERYKSVFFPAPPPKKKIKQEVPNSFFFSDCRLQEIFYLSKWMEALIEIADLETTPGSGNK